MTEQYNVALSEGEIQNSLIEVASKRIMELTQNNIAIMIISLIINPFFRE